MLDTNKVVQGFAGSGRSRVLVGFRIEGLESRGPRQAKKGTDP